MNLYETIKKNLKESDEFDELFWKNNLTLEKYRVEVTTEDNKKVVKFYTYDDNAYSPEDIINSSYLIASYYLDTLLEENNTNGLNLGNNYIISGMDWQEVLDFLNYHKNNINEAERPNNKVYIICYGELEIWSNRRSAFDYYQEGAGWCEGSEQERYMNIVQSLYMGDTFVDDGGPEKVTSISDRDEKGKRIAIRNQVRPMTHEEAFDFIKKGVLKESDSNVINKEDTNPNSWEFTDEEKEQYELDDEGYDEMGEKWTHCAWCEEPNLVSECRKEKNLGWLCDRCQSALYSRGEPAVYEDNDDYYEESEKLKESEAKILDFEETGGGVLNYVGEIGKYNFVGEIDGVVEFFDKSFKINDWGKYADIEEDAWNGKYGDDIQGAYDFEQKYAEFHPEYLKDISQALKDYADNNIKEPHYASQVYDEVERLKNYKGE